MIVDKLVFENNKNVNITDGLNTHISWLHEHVTGHPYVTRNYYYDSRQSKYIAELEEIPRIVHGTMDMARCAALVKPIMEMYRRHGDYEAACLTEREYKLIQIAASWHDSGRENDGKDEWDVDSAVNLYYYLTLTLGLAHDEAKKYAEAIANKDGVEYELVKKKGDNDRSDESYGCGRSKTIIAPDGYKWKRIDGSRKKNIIEKIIHDVDSFDIIRARPFFDATYLDFYKQFYTTTLSTEKKKQLLHDIGHLRNEISSVIEQQGDGWARYNDEIKALYNTHDSYALVEQIIKEKKLLGQLYNNNELLPLKVLQKKDLVKITPFDQVEEDDLQAKFQAYMLAGQLVARGIPTPSFEIAKPRPDGSIETAAELDFRKTLRRHDDIQEKNGNQNRACSLIGYAGGVFSSAGGLVCLDDESQIHFYCSTDSGTGFGKRKTVSSLAAALQTLTKDELFEKLAFGGTGSVSNFYCDAHAELNADISAYHGIYYTTDPCHMNQFTDPSGHALPAHVNAPFLQAIYLQQAYFKKTGKLLPIFEYSRLHGSLLLVNNVNEERIVELWEKSCTDYILSQLDNMNLKSLIALSTEDIKVLAVYGSLSNYYDAHNPIYGKAAAADSLYPDELKLKINHVIETKKLALINAHNLRIGQALENSELDKMSLTAIRYLAGQHAVSSELKRQYYQVCQEFVNSKSRSNGLDVKFDDNVAFNVDVRTFLKILYREDFSDIICSNESIKLAIATLMLNSKYIAFYYIAKYLGFSDICQSIREKFHKKVSNDLKNEYIHSEVCTYIKIFELDDYTELLIGRSKTALTQFLSDDNKSSPFHDNTIIYLIESGCEDEEFINLTQSCLQKCHVNVSEIEDYIAFAKKLRLDTHQIRDKLLSVFIKDKCRSVFSSKTTILSLMMQYDLLSDDIIFEILFDQMLSKHKDRCGEFITNVKFFIDLLSPKALSSSQMNIIMKKAENIFELTDNDIKYSPDCPLVISEGFINKAKPCTYYLDICYSLISLYYVDGEGNKNHIDAYDHRALNKALSNLTKPSNISDAEKSSLMTMIVQHQKYIYMKGVLSSLVKLFDLNNVKDLFHLVSQAFQKNIQLLLDQTFVNSADAHYIFTVLDKLDLVSDDIACFLTNFSGAMTVDDLEIYIRLAKRHQLSADIISLNITKVVLDIYNQDLFPFKNLLNMVKRYQLFSMAPVLEKMISISVLHYPEHIMDIIQTAKALQPKAEFSRSICNNIHSSLKSYVEPFMLPTCDDQFMSIITKCHQYKYMMDNQLLVEKLSDQMREDYLTIISQMANSTMLALPPALFYQLCSIDLGLSPAQQATLSRLMTLFKFNVAGLSSQATPDFISQGHQYTTRAPSVVIEQSSLTNGATMF